MIRIDFWYIRIFKHILHLKFIYLRSQLQFKSYFNTLILYMSVDIPDKNFKNELTNKIMSPSE